jgi:hypothetical protein
VVQQQRLVSAVISILNYLHNFGRTQRIQQGSAEDTEDITGEKQRIQSERNRGYNATKVCRSPR